ncbi:MAG: Uma2 family endonuclease [Planctomycetes bacterium]|nr:Uma2 family endonuclease [Planctomycetota bacterium]
MDGILVEKPMGFNDDRIGTRLIRLIGADLDTNNIGDVFGAQAQIRFKLDLVRVPDVSFIRWDRVDDTDVIENPAGAFLEVPPDLAVEVISPGNSAGEMAIKLDEYAKAGVKLVWYIDPERKEVDVYPKANPKRKKTLTAADTLTGATCCRGSRCPWRGCSRAARRKRARGRARSDAPACNASVMTARRARATRPAARYGGGRPCGALP